jgi:hypothetical protein
VGERGRFTSESCRYGSVEVVSGELSSRLIMELDVATATKWIQTFSYLPLGRLVIVYCMNALIFLLFFLCHNFCSNQMVRG